MARTRLDALAAALARVSERSEDELLIELKTNVIPQMKNPSGLYVEISDEEYERILNASAQEQEAFIKWLLEGAQKGGFDPPEN